MARFMVPIYPPLADPAAPDPADLTDFQVWTAANLPDIETSLDAAGNSLVSTSGAMDVDAALLDSMGLDLAIAFDELASYALEEDADDFVPELEAAGIQDAAINQAAVDLATQSGLVEIVSSPEPQNPAPPPATGTPVSVPPGGPHTPIVYAPPFPD